MSFFSIDKRSRLVERAHRREKLEKLLSRFIEKLSFLWLILLSFRSSNGKQQWKSVTEPSATENLSPLAVVFISS